MTAATRTQTPDSFGPVPVLGTYPVAADTLIYKGCMVALDGNGRAVNAADDGNGYDVIGWARQEVDNRTTASSGGGAGALNVDVDFGVVEYAYTGTAPKPREIVFCADNVTVAVSSTSAVSGYRGAVGVVTQVDTTNTLARVFINPDVTAMINSGVQDLETLLDDYGSGTATAYADGGGAEADAAAGLIQAESDISDLETELGDYTGGGGAEADVATGVVQAETDIAALEADALSAQAFIPIPLNAIRLATGAALPAYSDGVDGLTLQDSEAFGIRFNDGVHTAMAVSVPMPPDLDATADVVVHALGFRIGSADADAALAIGAFFQTVAAAHTADADAGGNTTAFDQATTIVSEETVTLALADVPAAPCALTLTLQSHTTLDADDMVLVGLWLEYTRALRTS